MRPCRRVPHRPSGRSVRYRCGWQPCFVDAVRSARLERLSCGRRPGAAGAFSHRAGLAAGGVPAAPPALAPALASLDCGALVVTLLAGCFAAVRFFLWVVALCWVAAGLPELLHEALAPLVGFPPKAPGMSSWKTCGMSAVTVRLT